MRFTSFSRNASVIPPRHCITDRDGARVGDAFAWGEVDKPHADAWCIVRTRNGWRSHGPAVSPASIAGSLGPVGNQGNPARFDSCAQLSFAVPQANAHA